MPETILGLELGANAVKALLAECRGRTDIRVLASETVALADGADWAPALEKLAGLLGPALSARTRCVVLLPASEAMFRLVRLPFRDEARIKKTLPFELEPLLPLPIEEVAADYIPLPSGGLLTAALARDRVRKILSAVEQHLAPVSVVDIGPAALALAALEQKAFSGAGIVLDIGRTESAAVFCEKNAPLAIRSFAFGGDAITGAPAAEGSCGREEAEKIKIDAASGERAAGVPAVCREFCNALSATVELLRLNETLSGAPVRILVTGGGSLFGPLREELARTFGAAVETLDAGKPGDVRVDAAIGSRWAPPEMSSVLAGVKRAHAARKSFNFRQGDLAAKSLGSDLGRHLRLGIVLASIILALAAADVFLDYRVQTGQADALKGSISRIFKKHFPPSAVMVDPVTQMKSRLAEDKKTYGLAGGASAAPVLELLRDMSGLIPPTLDVVVTRLHCENQVVLLAGEAKKVDDVTLVKNELAKSKYFKTVTVNKTALGRDGAKVNFDLRIELQ
ncbi:MAG: pilus assembly protein PilM [Deltaproteobacteria bacterium]|jgi:general secretion pathway protein L